MNEEQVVEQALLAAAEHGGIDGLYAALIAAIAGLVGWIVKRPQELLDAIRGREKGEPKADAVGDALAKHEAKCDARQVRIHARFDEVLKNQTDIISRLARLEGRHDAQ